MQTTHRPMTDRQKAELAGYVAWSTTFVRALLFFLVGFAVAGFFNYLALHTKPDVHFLWWLVPTLVVMAFLFVRAQRWTGGSEFRRQVKADLAQGTVAVHRIDAVEVIEVAEREDEGPSYFLKTTDGRVLVFSGQYLSNYQRRGFPWQSFEIVEAPTSKVFFSFKRLGEPLKPSFTREPFTWEEFKKYGRERYQTIDVDFERLKIKEVP